MRISKRTWAVSIAAIILIIVIVVFVYHRTAGQNRRQISPQASPVPAQFTDENFFLTTIKQSQQQPLPQHVTGITVPHHLLARDAIANVFSAASGGGYDRVIIISPDHFHLGKTKISYATKDFDTVFGQLPADREFISQLATVDQASPADFFYREHGIGAELPFVKYFFPNAKITAITLGVNAQSADVAGLISLLKKSVDGKTLVIQSTDFSHYLTATEANIKDQQTISLLDKIASGTDPNILYQLNEPDNLDCIACQYVQSSLQQSLHSAIHIIDHKNSQDYSSEPVQQTTSYIPQVYY